VSSSSHPEEEQGEVDRLLLGRIDTSRWRGSNLAGLGLGSCPDGALRRHDPAVRDRRRRHAWSARRESHRPVDTAEPVRGTAAVMQAWTAGGPARFIRWSEVRETASPWAGACWSRPGCGAARRCRFGGGMWISTPAGCRFGAAPERWVLGRDGRGHWGARQVRARRAPLTITQTSLPAAAAPHV